MAPKSPSAKRRHASTEAFSDTDGWVDLCSTGELDEFLTIDSPASHLERVSQAESGTLISSLSRTPSLSNFSEVSAVYPLMQNFQGAFFSVRQPRCGSDCRGGTYCFSEFLTGYQCRACVPWPDSPSKASTPKHTPKHTPKQMRKSFAAPVDLDEI